MLLVVMSLIVVHIDEFNYTTGFKYIIVSFTPLVSFLTHCTTCSSVASRSALCGHDVIMVDT